MFKDMSYDLGDPANWEFVFPSTDKPLLTVPSVDDETLDLDEEEVWLHLFSLK